MKIITKTINKKVVTIITPAWKRYEVSNIVFQNFYNLQKKLRKEINLKVIIISDDENLNIAKKFGFITVETDNEFLGRRFNNGFEKAIEIGSDFVLPVGSDSLITKNIILSGVKLSNSNSLVFSTMHSMLNEAGNKIGCINTASGSENQNKGALWFYNRESIINAGKRPCKNNINSSCDRHTINSILEHNKNINFKINNISYFQHLAIKSKDIQIWKYEIYRPQFVKEITKINKVILNNYGPLVLEELQKYYKML